MQPKKTIPKYRDMYKNVILQDLTPRSQDLTPRSRSVVRSDVILQDLTPWSLTPWSDSAVRSPLSRLCEPPPRRDRVKFLYWAAEILPGAFVLLGEALGWQQ